MLEYHTSSRLAELLGELSRCQWDVLLFKETRRADGDCKLGKGHCLYTSKHNTISAGVAILVHMRHRQNIKQVRFINDRVMFVDLVFESVVYRMISVYMPHAGYPHADLCDVYDQLRFILLEAQQFG